MGSVRGKMSKGGYKSRKRPKGISRSGLPKIYPSHINACLQSTKIK